MEDTQFKVGQKVIDEDGDEATIITLEDHFGRIEIEYLTGNCAGMIGLVFSDEIEALDA